MLRSECKMLPHRAAGLSVKFALRIMMNLYNLNNLEDDHLAEFLASSGKPRQLVRDSHSESLTGTLERGENLFNSKRSWR